MSPRTRDYYGCAGCVELLERQKRALGVSLDFSVRAPPFGGSDWRPGGIFKRQRQRPGSAGSVKTNRAPPLSARSIQIVPPWASTIPFAM